MAGVSHTEIRNLARFRYAIRRLLRLSEEAAREAGLTPHQHQLLLGIAGYSGAGYATVSDLAEFLQLRHHSVVGLIDRAQALGLVRRRPNPKDRREVHVLLTANGSRKLQQLSAMHRKELGGMRRSLDILDFASERSVRRTTKPSPGKARKTR